MVRRAYSGKTCYVQLALAQAQPQGDPAPDSLELVTWNGEGLSHE